LTMYLWLRPNKVRKKTLLIAVLLVALFRCLAADEAEKSLTTDDKELLDFFSRVPRNSPARYALNEAGWYTSWRAFKLLRGKWQGTDKDHEEAVKTLKQLRKRIEFGLKWPYKTPPSYEIPYAAVSPKIDGNINEACWKPALTFKGSYLLGSVKKENDGSVWKIMWNYKYFYVAAYFPDANIFASVHPGHPYKGDSLEIFLMPSKRMKKYWEVDIGCNGDLYDGFHCNNNNGKWVSGANEIMKGLEFKASRFQAGFSVEAAIPFKELPNYMLGNLPKVGEIIFFALVRTNKNQKNGKVEYSSAFPLLYGGHNIFGHAMGKFKK
jgi:hypothetical protein